MRNNELVAVFIKYGHCFYYAIAMLLDELCLHRVQQVHGVLHGTPMCLATRDFLRTAKEKQSDEEIEE